MPFQREKGIYDEHGFVVIERLWSDDQFHEVCGELDRYVRDVVPGLADTEAFYQDRSDRSTLKQLNRMGCDPYFRALMADPHWLELAERLVGEPVMALQPEWFNKPPGTRHVTPPHQDNFYFCLEPANVVTIWMAVDETGFENGCLRYVDGSHRRGFRPHGRSNILGFSQGITDYSHEDFQREMAVPLKAGQAVAHHGMTIHRADANVSSVRHRRGFAMVFQGRSCQRNEEAYARYLASSRSQQEALGGTGPNRAGAF
jgi:phytanoyl-CoA hydroxylase